MPLIDIYPEPPSPISKEVVLTMIVDIVPDDAADPRLWLPRLKVDGTERLLKDSATLDHSEPGQVLSADLQKVTDKDLITSDSVINFGIGKKIANVWHEASFITLIEDGRHLNQNYTIAGQPQNATDTVSIQVNGDNNEQLNRTSESGMVMYDSLRTQVSESDYKSIPGEGETSYTPEIIDFPDMQLSDIFDEILVTRMGFDSYVTDLPVTDWPIQRYDCSMGQRYLDALKGYYSMFSPSVTVRDNIIYIFDTTKERYAGFPNPKEVTLSVLANEVQLSQEKQKIDGLLMEWVGLEGNYDYTTIRHDYEKDTQGISRIERGLHTVEFRKIINPTTSIVIRELLNWEDKDTYVNDVLSEESTDFFEFGSGGEYEFRRKTVNSLLPDPPDMDTESLQHSREEREDFILLDDPWHRGRRYIAARTLRVNGLIVSDADNPNSFGEPAVLDAPTARRSNIYNNSGGQSHLTQAIYSLRETAEPLRDSTVRVRRLAVDEVNSVVIEDKTEIRAGEIGVNGSSTQTHQMVIREDLAERSTERLVPFHVGELPMKYALPLAKRVLRFLQTKGQTLQLTHIAYDPSLVKGQTIQPKDREGVSLGNYIILGTQLRVSSGGLFVSMTCKEIADTSDPLTYSSWATIIEEGDAQVFTIPVECFSDTTLYASVVSDLLVEARISGVGGYTNIETGVLDLSAYQGTTQDIDIRVTAGSIAGTQIVRRTFTITVAGDFFTIEPLTKNGEVVTKNGDPVYKYA